MTTAHATAAVPADDLPAVKTTRKRTTAKKAVAATPAPAPAAEPVEAKATKTAVVNKIKWTLDGERDAKGAVAQHGTSTNGSTYTITGSGKEWTAVVAGGKGTKPETLVENVGHTTAYLKCTGHAKAQAVAA